MVNRLRRILGKGRRGQGLVEMTLVLPVLLIMLLGVIELGFLFRAHLIITNANREAARFASRGTFTTDEIVERAITTVSNMLPLRLVEDPVTGDPANTALIITHIVIPGTGESPVTDPVYRGVERDDIVSMIDPPDKYADQFKKEAEALFVEDPKDKKSVSPVAQEMVYVEMFYVHPEVLGAPIVDWVFPDEMIVHSWTVMRVLPPR